MHTLNLYKLGLYRRHVKKFNVAITQFTSLENKAEDGPKLH